MSKRIDQLLVKAGAYFGGEGIVYDNFDPKKFAELIVTECIDQIKISSPDRPYMANQIKKRVGIAE